MLNTTTRKAGYQKKCALSTTSPGASHGWALLLTHVRIQQGIKKKTGKTTKAEEIPKIGTGKGDSHGSNTTLIKRRAPAIVTVCLATTLGASTKGWGDSLLGKCLKRD